MSYHLHMCGFHGWLSPGVSGERGGRMLIQNDAAGLGCSKDMEGTLLLSAHGIDEENPGQGVKGS